MPTTKEAIVQHLEGVIAEDDFILKFFPMAKSGDTSPEVTFQLSLALEKSIEDWVLNNVPEEHWGILEKEVDNV